jgi:hypothetical protein
MVAQAAQGGLVRTGSGGVLGDEDYERARAEGYAMSLEEAVAFALEEPD